MAIKYFCDGCDTPINPEYSGSPSSVSLQSTTHVIALSSGHDTRDLRMGFSAF